MNRLISLIRLSCRLIPFFRVSKCVPTLKSVDQEILMRLGVPSCNTRLYIILHKVVCRCNSSEWPFKLYLTLWIWSLLELKLERKTYIPIRFKLIYGTTRVLGNRNKDAKRNLTWTILPNANDVGSKNLLKIRPWSSIINCPSKNRTCYT